MPDLQNTFDSDEQLADIEVAITGAETATLTEADYSESGSGPYTYTATYTANTDGDYTFTLNTAADAAGNDGASGQTATYTVGGLPVDAIAHYDPNENGSSDGSTLSTLTDREGSNDLSASGGVTLQTGSFGTMASYAWDGTDTVASTSELIDSPFSVAIWIRANSLPGSSDKHIVGEHKTDTDDRDWRLKWNSNDSSFTLEVSHDGTTNTVLINSTTTPTTGTWYFLGARVDPSNNDAALFVDDTKEATGDPTPVNDGPTPQFSLGDGVTFDQPWDGNTQELIVGNVAWTDQEFTDLYNRRSGEV